MYKVAVVIPIYKEAPDEIEKIALTQVVSVLGRYPIILVAPESMNVSKYFEAGIKEVRAFPDECFVGVESYSSLCMTYSFYERFSEFEYILIYQLDAFVFEDRLLEFCDKGCDYIGAPVPSYCWDEVPFHVGNGGFSLRKVSRFIEVLKNKKKILEGFTRDFGNIIKDRLKGREDCFFGYCGYSDEIDFVVPDINDAFDFSIEYNINAVYEDIKEHLPFGCHRWNTYRFSTWWSIISSLGYEITDESCRKYSKLFQEHEYNLLIRVIKSGDRKREIGKFCKEIIGNDSVSIWGYGREGKKIVSYLEELGIGIINKYDRDLKEDDISIPNRSILRNENHMIIITTTKYENEVANELHSLELEDNKDYITWREMATRICQALGIFELGEIIM